MASFSHVSSSSSSPPSSPPGTSAQGANTSSPSKRSAPDRSEAAKKQKTTTREATGYYEHPVVGSTAASAQKAMPPSWQDGPSGRQIYYVHTPNAPIDVDIVQRAIANLGEANFYDDLSLRHSMLNYLTTLVRVAPYLDARDKAVVQPLLDMWEIKHAEFEECESLGADERFELWRKENSLASRCAKNDDERRALCESARRELVWGKEPVVRRGVQLLSGESLRQADEVRLSELLDMTEDPLPWSAWALRDDLEERLVAAARYIDTFSFSWVKGKTLAGEPALQGVRQDAMHLLAEGGVLNAGVALLFLKAYAARSEKEKEVETAADAIGKGKGQGRANAPTSDKHGSANEDEEAFNLSDGDDAYEELEEEEGEVTESESEE